MGKRYDFSARLTRYMADKMPGTRRASHAHVEWIASHMAAFALAERRHTRRAIAPALKRLAEHADCDHAQLRACPRCLEDCDAIDRATRAPKRRGRNAR